MRKLIAWTMLAVSLASAAASQVFEGEGAQSERAGSCYPEPLYRVLVTYVKETARPGQRSQPVVGLHEVMVCGRLTAETTKMDIDHNGVDLDDSKKQHVPHGAVRWVEIAELR